MYNPVWVRDGKPVLGLSPLSAYEQNKEIPSMAVLALFIKTIDGISFFATYNYFTILYCFSQQHFPFFFYDAIPPFGFVVGRNFIKSVCFINMPGNDLCRNGQQKYFLISFFSAKIQSHIHKSVAVSTLSHFWFEHEKAKLCRFGIDFCYGNTSGRYTVTFQNLQAVCLWIEIINKTIDDFIHIKLRCKVYETFSRNIISPTLPLTAIPLIGLQKA